MRSKPLFLVVLLTAALALASGLVLLGCGGSATTTTQSTTATTLATTTTSSAATTTSSAATTSSSGPAAAPVKILVPLTGAEVAPPVQTSASGTFTLFFEATATGSFNISYELEVENIADVTAAHIHMGAKGAEGPVVVPLFTGPPKTGSFSGMLAKGTITEADLAGPLKGKTFPELAGAVLAGQTYVNVHTTKNPNGEIRGQIIMSAAGATSTTAGATTSSSSSGY